MRNTLIPTAVVLTILSLFATGCAVDLVADRPGEKFHLIVKPAPPAADQVTSNEEI